MSGVLQVLKDNGFKCYDPKVTDSSIDIDEVEGSRPVYRPFETPAPDREQIEVIDSPTGTPSLFRYFLDGSMRTTSAGHVVDTKRRFLPLFIAQIGVAATKLNHFQIGVESYTNKNVLFLPETFADGDIQKARRLVRQAAQTSRLPLELNVESYELEDQQNPIDCARKKVLNTMHDMEIDLIMNLAESHKATRDSLLMVDGSLQFYRNLEKAKEAFRNVVGVAKSFDLNQQVGTGPNAKEVGTLVTALRHRHRTPARKIEHRNLVIGSWYLRLHSTRSHPRLAATDGVVKLEVFPDDTAAGPNPTLDTDRCNLISRNVLALRHPATPWTDSRWASHLYPVYLTERYIKARFRSDQTIRACL